MKTGLIAVLLAYCSAAAGQISDYLGPGILNRGAGEIGRRAGQDVALRFFVNANGIYDTGIVPFSLDSTGTLAEVNGLYGMEVALGAYGVHDFRHARLGLDYNGSYRHYTQKSFYDGTDHQLALGYTHQKSRRVVFDLRQLAGSVSQATSFGGGLPAVQDGVIDQSSLLFDNRANYLQSSLDVNFLHSQRTIFTLGGQGYGVWRKASALIGVQGYDLHGSVQRRVSQWTTIGLSYQHVHFDFPKAFGEADLNLYSAIWARQMGRIWTVTLRGGAYQAETQGLQRVSVDPAVTALLGISSAVQTFYRQTLVPQSEATLAGQFRRAGLAFRYRRGISSGNGVYLTSREESFGADFSYMTERKWSFSLVAQHFRLIGIGQGLRPYSLISGTANVTYAMKRALHVVAAYNARHQDITEGVFRRTSYRATIGLSFSPGDVPLALH